jgi:hypothetical protein
MKILFSLLFLSFLNCSPSAAIRYSVAEKQWDESFGNHRAVIEVQNKADAVYLDLVWRRHDRWPEKKKFVIVNAANGDTIQNIHRLQVDNEKCRIVFGPVKTPGSYYFYYLPYEVQKEFGFYDKNYLPVEPAPNENWLSNNKTDLKKLPEAILVEFQSRSAFDSFYPMEIIPLASEKRKFLARVKTEFLVFPEGRENPIRMKDEIPLKWIEKGVSNQFSAEVLRNEYFAFQLGIFAHKMGLQNVQVKYSDFKNGDKILKASQFTCINTGGFDPYGNSFVKKLDIDSGFVQPLWIGIDITENAVPGKYKGTITVTSENARAQQIAVELTIKNEVLADRGDSEPWRHSRLRWLNSSMGIDDLPTASCQPIRYLGDNTYDFSGKLLKMASTGMPESINIYGTEILKNPISFVVEYADGQKMSMKTENVQLLKNEPGTMIGAWENYSEKIKMSGVGIVESDGYFNFKIKLKASEAVDLKDVRIEIPFKSEVAKYMMGMGLPGTTVPESHSAKWDGPYDSFWLGNTKGGLWCELRGSDYTGPLLNLYHPDYPESWFNENKGGFKIENHENQTKAIVYSGNRKLNGGEEIEFEWSFLMTPVKKPDTKSQFENRYYHNGGEPMPPDDVFESGVKIVNLHHANQYNPHINYPFIAVEEMKSFVDELHKKGQKVKIYYTIRELTNYTTEIWALRSLGSEILGDGRGYGYPWLCEHFINGYRPQWYQWFPDKSADASVVNAPGDSRWLNYYIEGLAWLVRNVDIDGLYLDDVTFDRRTVKRIRKVLDNEKPGCMIDLHSNTGFSKGPATQYAEFFPYMDKIWFGESFQYNKMSPENWLVEVSGIPFGLMGDMLQGGGNRWLGMLFGMTTRLPWTSDEIKADPRPVWKIWDEFRIADAKMVGFWDDEPMVQTGNDAIKATTYLKDGKALISLGNFSEKEQTVKLSIDWRKIGIEPQKAKLICPDIKDFQPGKLVGINEEIVIEPKKGWLIIIE